MVLDPGCKENQIVDQVAVCFGRTDGINVTAQRRGTILGATQNAEPLLLFWNHLQMTYISSCRFPPSLPPVQVVQLGMETLNPVLVMKMSEV
ncbi:hypothetical protein EJB05_08768 [Eragrostis curvula]|uniref:Uncharacterized protein n=1 Tax=Eragrostis curvula TaxID=38414 RepID=A0A5J9W381_9POAL|nr:hypothetical protein EJB05_08768 [Eragrostis curvula]